MINLNQRTVTKQTLQNSFFQWIIAQQRVVQGSSIFMNNDLFTFGLAICLHFQITDEDGEVIDSASNGDQIIEVKGEEEGEGRNVQDLPILVLLDLPEPAKDQTEEELVESFLNKTFDLPQSSVKTAFRLPIRSNGMYLLSTY